MSEQQLSEQAQFSIISVPDKNPVFDPSTVPSEDSDKEMLTGWLLQVSKKFDFYEKLDAKRNELMNMNIAKIPDGGASFKSHFYGNLFAFICLFIVVWIIASIVGYFWPNVVCSFITWKFCLIASVVLGLFVSRHSKKSEAKFKKEWKQKVADIDLYFQDVNFSNLYMNTTSILGSDYRYSFATGKFASYFINGRCDTLKEAKNLFEQECANMRLENKMNGLEERASAAMKLAESAYSMAKAAYNKANSIY